MTQSAMFTDDSAPKIKAIITCPLPDPRLSPNSRAHRMTKAGLTKRYRRDCGIAAQAALRAAGIEGRRPLFEAATVTATFYHRTARRRDRDNALASIKAAIDSLQDAGVIGNDHHLTFAPPEFVGPVSAREARLELAIVGRPACAKTTA